ncbi:hypothetical protein E3O55_13010 [Cryobacterium sp. MDB1-18-2]|uniref:hypothetical protein n=1 Tax=unclassified Cryobacterium TaxID=2649013 RepID=UPI001068F7AC|nr:MULTISPECIES: hypothetical protein [unclassified Cryobacterium]TFC26993.1 hypothetical protein E3O55_13010 [Cryobacterium sp. MDB1-18-2]TFC44185.1 hypothetical protein E3O50_06025 [Cryobacterium sp. MDB1-18-1]
MPTPTAFEIKCANESMGIPRPDLTALFKSIDARMEAGIDYDTPETPAPVVTRLCIRCERPVEGEKCGHCRAIQSSYVAKR